MKPLKLDLVNPDGSPAQKGKGWGLIFGGIAILFFILIEGIDFTERLIWDLWPGAGIERSLIAAVLLVLAFLVGFSGLWKYMNRNRRGKIQFERKGIRVWEEKSTRFLSVDGMSAYHFQLRKSSRNNYHVDQLELEDGQRYQFVLGDHHDREKLKSLLDFWQKEKGGVSVDWISSEKSEALPE